MARFRRQEPDSDPVALAHGDPDMRPTIIVDGLVVDGRDPFAERRRRLRELHDGRPDPAPSESKRRQRKEIPMATHPPSLRQAPATPGSYEIISRTDFEALAPGRGSVADALAPAIDALARGVCVRLSVAATRVAATRQALRKLAGARGFKVEIRSGVDYVAARRVGGVNGQEDLAL